MKWKLDWKKNVSCDVYNSAKQDLSTDWLCIVYKKYMKVN